MSLLHLPVASRSPRHGRGVLPAAR